MKALFSKYKQGFSLVELVLALALLSFLIVAVLFGQWSIDDIILNSIREIILARAAEENLLNNALLERARSTASQAGSFASTSSGSLLFGVDYKINNLPFSSCAFGVLFRGWWSSAIGGERSREYAIVRMLPGSLSALGGDCSGVIQGFDGTVLGNANEVYFPNKHIRSVDTVGTHVVAAFDNQLAFIDQGAGTTHVISLYANIEKVDFVPQKDVVFAVLNSSTTQLAVIDASSRLITATSTLPGVAGMRPGGVSVHFSDNKVFVGTKRTAGHEFHIFDVSDTSHPIWLGSREMNHNINDIAVSGHFAFLATSGNVRDLIVLNIENPSNIVSVSEINLPGTEDGRSVAVSYNYISLGRHKSTAPGSSELWLLRFWPVENGLVSVEQLAAAKTDGDVVGVQFAAQNIVAITNNASQELQFFKPGLYQNGTSTVFSLERKVVENLPAKGSAIDTGIKNMLIGSENGLYEYTF